MWTNMEVDMKENMKMIKSMEKVRKKKFME